MPAPRTLLAVAFSSLAALACSTSRMDVQVIQYPGAPARKPVSAEACSVDLLEADHFALARCRQIGDAFVGDSGTSRDCEEPRVRHELQRAACRAGANTMVVRAIEDPHSDCFQARAVLLVCPDPAVGGDP